MAAAEGSDSPASSVTAEAAAQLGLLGGLVAAWPGDMGEAPRGALAAALARTLRWLGAIRYVLWEGGIVDTSPN